MSDIPITPGQLSGLVPIPDPTALTNSLVAQAKDDIRRELNSDQQLLLQAVANLRAELVGLTSVEDEKFRGVAAAFTAAAELAKQSEHANQLAATKSEASFTKQIDQLYVLIDTRDKAQSARVEEIKERIDRGEGGSTGRMSERTERRAVSNQMLALITVVVFGISVIVAVIAIYHK